MGVMGLGVTGTALAIVLALLLLAAIWLYNRLIRAKIKARQAWAQVAVQQQRRHDLIPALVGVVQGNLTHEADLLRQVTETRSRALTAGDHLARQQDEDALSALLGRLLLITEGMPTLRADETVRKLQTELRATEDRLAFARGFATDRVARYRELTDTLPGMLIARPFGFPRGELFVREDERAALAPDVRLGG